MRLLSFRVVKASGTLHRTGKNILMLRRSLTRATLTVSVLVPALAASGCGESTSPTDAGTDAFVPIAIDAYPLWIEVGPGDRLDASRDAAETDAYADDASGPDSGSILPSYDGGDPFRDDGGLGDPAWVPLEVLTGDTACVPLIACGGDVVGTWDVTGGCFELPVEAELSRCPGAEVTRRDGRARGRVTFDGLFAHRVAQSEVVVEIAVPALCADFVGGCDAIADLILSSAPDSTCVTEASGDCRCAARQVSAIDDADGYTLAGNQIVSATLGRRWDYCIEGGSLRYRDVTPGASAREPGIIELGRR